MDLKGPGGGEGAERGAVQNRRGDVKADLSSPERPCCQMMSTFKLFKL